MKLRREMLIHSCGELQEDIEAFDMAIEALEAMKDFKPKECGGWTTRPPLVEIS